MIMHYPPMRLWHRIMEQDKEQSLNESSHYRVTHVIKIFIRIHSGQDDDEEDRCVVGMGYGTMENEGEGKRGDHYWS